MALFSDWDQAPIKTGATADPAAGANPADITVPAGKRWLFLYAYCSFVTSADVANRYLHVDFLHDGTNIAGFAHSATALTASSTWYLAVTPGSANISASTYQTAGTSGGVELPSAGVIRISFVNKQAADDCGVVRYVYKEMSA